MEDLVLVLGIDEGSEAHVVQLGDPVGLIRLKRRVDAHLHFKHRPVRSIKDDEVRHALHIAAVVLQDQASLELLAESLDDLGLINSLFHGVPPPKT